MFPPINFIFIRGGHSGLVVFFIKMSSCVNTFHLSSLDISVISKENLPCFIMPFTLLRGDCLLQGGLTIFHCICYFCLFSFSLPFSETVSETGKNLPFSSRARSLFLFSLSFLLKISLYSFARTAFCPSVSCLRFSANKLRKADSLINNGDILNIAIFTDATYMYSLTIIGICSVSIEYFCHLEFIMVASVNPKIRIF